MKIILRLFSFVILLIGIRAQAGTCSVAGFVSQSSIDNFSSTYPGCTEILNTAWISGSNITNLNGFAGVTSTNGLNIIDNPLLTSIAGLSSLTSSGDLNIENNPHLVDLSGLGELVSTNQFRVVFNTGLTSLAGVEKLKTVNGFFSVGGNTPQKDFSGLENLTSIGGEAAISLSDNLTSLQGLENLESIGGYLYIGNNAVLADLSALSKLTTVSNYINIENNDALTTLSGIDNINMTNVGYIKIQESAMLSVCGVKSICTFLYNGNSRLVSGNAMGCNTPQEIIESGECQVILPVSLISFSGESGMEGNKLTWKTSWESGNSGFSIEKSLNARQFETIGFLAGVGNSKVDNSYTFTDPTPEKTTYYRLKQIDYDQSFQYSRIISVKREGNEPAARKVSVFPNPASGQLSIDAVDRNQKFSLQTQDGRTVKEGQQLPVGPIDTSNLKEGIYLLKVGKDVFKVIIAN